MSSKREVDYLIDNLNAARVLTKMYLSKLKGVDMTQTFQCGDVSLNSAYWVVGHIAWAENMLLLRGTGAKRFRFPWLKAFEIGSEFVYTSEMPPIKEVIDGMKLIREKVVEHLQTIEDGQLDQPNALDFTFAGENSIRMIIQHAARHEASHAGHLGWLCKLHGLKTI